MERCLQSRRVLRVLVGVWCVSVLFAFGCSQKQEYTPPPTPPPAPTINLSVSLNQVPVDLSESPAATVQVRDPDGTERQVAGLRVSDWLAGLPGLTPEDFFFNFVDNTGASLLDCLGGIQGDLPTAEDLAHAYFYDGSADDNGLQVLWDDERDACLFANNLDGGSVATVPNWALLEKKNLAYVMEMTAGTRARGGSAKQAGQVPAHLGETVYVEAVATIGSGVMVSGRYLKFHIQDATAGVYVFADTQATQETAGYDGSTFNAVRVYEGDRVYIHGTIGEHNGMVEFYPVSGYEVAVVASGQPVPTPHIFTAVDPIYASGYDYVGQLVRVNNMVLQAEGEEDPQWPEYGQKSKGLKLMAPLDLNTLYMDIYPGSGIPGSTPPSATGFNVVGVLQIQVDDQDQASYTLYPRALYDLNPLGVPAITGHPVSVYKFGQPEDQWVTVNAETLPQCGYDMGGEGGPGLDTVISLASYIVPEVTADPGKWEYKIKARDGRQPFDPLSYSDLKSGVLYLGDFTLNSHFYPGMGLSDIFYLLDVSEVILFPVGGGPQPGQAEHGKGINLNINGTNFAVNFKDLPAPGLTERPLSDFVPDNIMDIYTMGGSFSYDQIRQLYDYRLVTYGGAAQCFPVTWGQINPVEGDVPMVNLTGGVPVVTGLEGVGCVTLTDLFTIEMVRKVEVNGQTLYWKDLPTTIIDLGGGQTETVVFFRDVLGAAGLVEADRLLYDYYLWAIDDFGTYFPYKHGHLVDMYFNPLTNRGFVTADWNGGEMPAYGGRYSTKAIARIDFRQIDPAGALPVVCAVALGGAGYLHDPNSGDTCNGCHYKKGSVQIPVNCMDCHTACP